MLMTKRILGVIIVLALVASAALFIGRAVAAADGLALSAGTPLPPPPEGQYVPDQIIVRFKESTLRVTEANLNENLGTEVIHSSFAGFEVLQIPEGKTVLEMVEAYSRNPLVEDAQPNYIYYATWTPNDSYYSDQWHFDQINLETAWDLDTVAPIHGGDPSIIVAILDTGVAYETYDGYVQAPDLAATNFVGGWDFVNDDAHANDDHGHGTHVCGTIAQSTNNNEGTAGIAFCTTIMPVKVLEPEPESVDSGDGKPGRRATGTAADLVEGIIYAVDHGADIINLSLGQSLPDTELENALAYAYNAGVVVIAASGNSGDSTPQYPASYDDYVISVGATRYDRTRPAYSSYGSHLDVVAPGGDVSIDQNADGYPDGVLQQTIIQADPASFDYAFFQGTSMACPHVAGVAALVLAKNPDLTPDQVRQALQSTATDLGAPGWDEIYGWGLINAPAAVAWAGQPDIIVSPPSFDVTLASNTIQD
jgi:serine protease